VGMGMKVGYSVSVGNDVFVVCRVWVANADVVPLPANDLNATNKIATKKPSYLILPLLWNR
jgi:hypothetical protein